MTMSYKGLTQSSITLSQIQLVITFNIWPDLGPKCLKELSADENVMLRFNANLRYIEPTPTCHNL